MSRASWRRTVARVLDRDGHTCRLRRPGCTLRATDVHAWKAYGAADPLAALVAVCAHCRMTGSLPDDPPPATPPAETLWP